MHSRTQSDFLNNSNKMESLKEVRKGSSYLEKGVEFGSFLERF